MKDKYFEATVNKPRKHANSMFVTKHNPGGAYQSAQVCEANDNALDIGFWANGKGYLHKISRKDARLLARRINQCLDATVR